MAIGMNASLFRPPYSLPLKLGTIIECIAIFFVLQASTLKPYLNAVRETLNAAICLQNFDSQMVERHNKPEVEVK